MSFYQAFLLKPFFYLNKGDPDLMLFYLKEEKRSKLDV